MVTSKLTFSQLPTVYFNKVYNVSALSSNSATLTTLVTGTNFKFVGDLAGTNGVFTTSNGTVTGKLIYINAAGSNVVYSGFLDKKSTSGQNTYGFVFEGTGAASGTNFFCTNPAQDANVSGSGNQQLNSGNVLGDLNTMRNDQVVLLADFFVSNFSTCLNTVAATQSFNISGSKLVSAVTVTAPSNFEISKDQTTWATSLAYANTAGVLASSVVYVRMKSISVVGSYTGTLTVAATNAATQTYTLNGDVNPSTAISAQPTTSVTICSGNATSFSLTATGSNLSNQWQVSTDGTNYTNLTNTGIYTGATTSVLRLSSGVTSSYNGYKYKCIVTGDCGTAVTSSVITLTVNSPVSISAQPVSASICAASNTSFSVTAAGAGLTYQWQVNTGSGYTDISNGGVYSNATTPTLTITGATQAMNGYSYKCVVTGTCSTLTSTAATLTINAAPATPGAISGYTSICGGTNQSYSITPVSGATAYSWIIPGSWSGTSTVSSINVVSSATSGNIQVRAENSCGNSSYQTLAVSVSGTSAPTPSFSVNNQIQCLSSNNFSFTNESTAADGTTISYSWDFGNSSGTSTSTSPTYTYAAVGTYVVKLDVTASNGCIASLSKQVTVNGAPTSTISGTTTICQGSSATLTVNLTGQGPWVLNYTDAASPISVSTTPYIFSVSPASTKTYLITSLNDTKCAAAGSDLIGSAIVTVNSNVTPAVTISAASTSICSANTVLFSSSGLSNQGASPSYQWLKNGVSISGATSSSYTSPSNSLADDDVISLQLISNSTSCLTTNTVVSNTIAMLVHPSAPASPMAISGDTTQCSSLTNQVYSVAPVLNATTYTWTLPAGWSIVSGSGTNSIVATIGSTSGDVSVTAGNGCGTSSAQLLPVLVNSSSSNPINLTSGVGSDTRTTCIGSAISNITYSSSGGTGATFSGLPNGVSGTYSAGNITISGTPSVAGTYNYLITLTGGGCNFTKTGTIIVNAANTIALSSATGTNAQTICINSALTDITYSTTGATNATVSGLPAGLNYGFSSNTVTISGTPTASGTFSYTVTLTGGCSVVTATGSVVVTAAKTISLSSAANSDVQSLCINSSLATLTYSSSGGTGAVFSGLPTGVTGSYNSGSPAISGSPSVAGTYNYSVIITGGCGSASATGTIAVSATLPNASIASNGGSICAGFDATFTLSGTANSVVTYSINGGSSSTVTLSNGNNNNGTITVTGALADQQLTLSSVQETTYGCTKNVTGSSTVTIRQLDEWTSKGNSENFHTAANWCKNGVPGASSNIIVPVVASGIYPKLTGQDAEISNMEIQSGAKINLNGRKLIVGGIVSGTGLLVGNSSSTLEFAGSADIGTIYLDQTSTDSKTIGSLKVNRSGKTLTLGSNAIVGAIDLTAGNVDIGNNELVISTSSSNASASSYIKISGTGKVKKSISNGSNFTFPVGNTAYNPITITNNNASPDNFTVNLLDEVYMSYNNTTGVGTTLSTAPRVKRTWNIGKENANSSTIDFVFNWNASEESTTLTTPTLYHFESGSWVKQTGTTSVLNRTLTYSGYNGTFSPFAIGEANISLPVNWLAFTAAPVHGTVKLNWSTASEQNNAHFEIERSADAMMFSKVGIVLASLNPLVRNDYQYIDQSPITGHSFYRLRQVDRDGKFSYSSVLQVNGVLATGYKVWTIPGQDLLNVDIPQSVTGAVDLMIFDLKGSLIQQKQILPGHNSINLSKTNAGGLYYIKIQQKGVALYTDKFIK